MIALSTYRPYHHERVSNILIDSDVTPVLIQNFPVADLSAGMYEVTLSIIFSSPDTNDFVQFVYSSDDASIQTTTIRKEAQDADDLISSTFVFPISHAGGIFSIKVEGLLEAGGMNATVQDSVLIYEKKGE